MSKEKSIKVLKDITKVSAFLALFYSISKLSLNEEQKVANRELFNHQCQYPGCKRKFNTTAHVHHVIPQGFSLGILGMSPDHPTNLVPICDWHHLGYPAFGGSSPIGPEDVWNPIHPDNTFASLLMKGRLRYVDDKYKKKYPEIHKYYLEVAEEFDHLPSKVWKDQRPELYAKYVQIGEEMGVEKITDIVHKVVMRKLRNKKLYDHTKTKDERIYWMPAHDPDLQIRSIERFVQATKEENWKYPLRFFSYSSRAKTGQYVWDTMAVILVERNVLSLARSRTSFKRIFNEMKSGRKPSWQVYYDRIYWPAVRGYQKDMDVNEIVQNYLDSLTESKYKSIVKKYNDENRAGERDKAFNILEKYFFRPAINHSRLKSKKKISKVVSEKKQTQPSGLRRL